MVKKSKNRLGGPAYVRSHQRRLYGSHIIFKLGKIIIIDIESACDVRKYKISNVTGLQRFNDGLCFRSIKKIILNHKIKFFSFT